MGRNRSSRLWRRERDFKTYKKWDEIIERLISQDRDLRIVLIGSDNALQQSLEILKKFSEIKVIVKQFPNSKYFASGDLLLISKLWVKSTNEIPNNQKMK